MRRYCLEAFSATTDDVATPRFGKSHGVKVLVGLVVEEERDMVTEYRQHSWVSRHAMQELPQEGRLWQVLSNVST